MANAKKCDRCGKIYEERRTNVFEELVDSVCDLFQTEKQKTARLMTCMVDLCPSCTKELMAWFMEGTDNGRT